MSAEFLILDNEKAAKLFSKCVWPAGSWRCITKAFFCGWIPEKFLSGPDIVPALD